MIRLEERPGKEWRELSERDEELSQRHSVSQLEEFRVTARGWKVSTDWPAGGSPARCEPQSARMVTVEPR